MCDLFLKYSRLLYLSSNSFQKNSYLVWARCSWDKGQDNYFCSMKKETALHIIITQPDTIYKVELVQQWQLWIWELWTTSSPLEKEMHKSKSVVLIEWLMMLSTDHYLVIIYRLYHTYIHIYVCIYKYMYGDNLYWAYMRDRL